MSELFDPDKLRAALDALDEMYPEFNLSKELQKEMGPRRKLSESENEILQRLKMGGVNE